MIQLVLRINKKATLSEFEHVYCIISKLFLSTHPDVRLRMQFEDEFSHDSLLMVINVKLYIHYGSKQVAYEIVEPSLIKGH